MDFRLFVTDLDRKRLSVHAIHNDIVATLRPNIVKYNIVTHYLLEAKFSLSTEEASDADDRKPFDDADEAFLFALNENPFASVPQLSRLIHLPPTTVHGCLIQFLGFTTCYLRWVPHDLLNGQKNNE
jgi:hypothetical protein